MIIKKIIFIILFTCSFNGSYAYPGTFNYTIEQLSDQCENNGIVSHSFCQGYIKGAINNTGVLCIPDDISLEQIIRIFRRWSANHPEQLHFSADQGIFKALDESFPCKERGSDQLIANASIFLAKTGFDNPAIRSLPCSQVPAFSISQTSPVILPESHENDQLGHSNVLKILFPQQKINFLPQKIGLIPVIKDGKKYIQISHIVQDQMNGNIFHVLTDRWDAGGLSHIDQGSIGYARLDKVGNNYQIKVPHKFFDNVGEWGKINSENYQLVQIGREAIGLVYFEKSLHQGIISNYCSVYEIRPMSYPLKIFHFFMEPSSIENAKVYFEPKKSDNSIYYDLVMEGLDNNFEKQTYRWKRQGSSYAPVSNYAGYYHS